MTLACEDTFSKPLENNHFFQIISSEWRSQAHGKAEMVKNYKENNPEATKRNRLRYSVKVSEKRANDEDFDKECKEKERRWILKEKDWKR